MNKIIMLILLVTLNANAQSFNIFVDTVASQTNLDSLVKTVRILSGEDSVFVDGTKTLIKNRNRFADNSLAARFITQKLTQYGLEVQEQVFSATGQNIYAVQRGNVYPNSYYIISAHYDAVTDYAADDNASGTSTVLEAARLLNEHQPSFSIIYTFFDDEEIGLFGSKHFAADADATKMDIKGVLNFDMIGWDGDNDNEFEIHSSFVGQSLQLAQYIEELVTIYNFPLKANIQNEGTNRSDHAPFWDYSYPAVLFIEELFGSDFNPNYHSALDRINKFNLQYFRNVAAIGITSLISLAYEETVTSMQEFVNLPKTYQLSNYPNPFNPTTVIQYNIPATVMLNSVQHLDAKTPKQVRGDFAKVRLVIYDVLGNEVATLIDERVSPGTYQIRFDASDLSSGMYIYNLTTPNGFISNKMLLVK